MGSGQTKENRKEMEAKKKQYETLEQTKEALYDMASDGSCWSMCCMKNPANGRLICCKCIRDICFCCVSLFNCKLFSCMEFDCGCPQCCKCMWCDDCCGTNPEYDMESGDMESGPSENDNNEDGASKEESEKAGGDDEEATELLSGRRRRRLTNYYRDNYSTGFTKF